LNLGQRNSPRVSAFPALPLVWDEKSLVTNSYSIDNCSVRQMILPIMILQNNMGQNHKDVPISDGQIAAA
jgi:hypothetical protein